MGRVNVNLLEKIEEHPSRIGMYKSHLKVFGAKKNLQNHWKRYDHGEHYFRTIRQIIRGSIGKNWDKVVENIKSKIPESYWHSIYNQVNTIEQHKNGYWYIKANDGDFIGYGRKTSSMIKNDPVINKFLSYYINKQGILKKFTNKSYKHKRYKLNKSEQRHINSFNKIANHLKSIADFYRIIKECSWNKKITFKHPTKTVDRKRYNKETDSWITIGQESLSVSLTINQFKNWCEINNFKYLLYHENTKSYETNMKWSTREINI